MSSRIRIPEALKLGLLVLASFFWMGAAGAFARERLSGLIQFSLTTWIYFNILRSTLQDFRAKDPIPNARESGKQ